MKIQAFFWDYDNTILETAEAHWNKHLVVLGRYGIHLSEKHRQRLYENNGTQNWEWMKEELGLEVSQEEYLKEIDTEFHNHLNRLEMRSGVQEVLKIVAANNIPQAIVTNARRNSAEPVLQQKNIFEMMKFILCKEDYTGRKPDPSPYLEAFKRMEIVIGQSLHPNRCIAVEDDPKGVEAAHKAGAIVIHRKLNPKEPDCTFADYSCYSKEEFISIVQKFLI